MCVVGVGGTGAAGVCSVQGVLCFWDEVRGGFFFTFGW